MSLKKGNIFKKPFIKTKEASKYYNQALQSLQKGFELLYPWNLKLASLALKYQVYALYNQQTRDSLLKALSTISQILGTDTANNSFWNSDVS